MTSVYGTTSIISVVEKLSIKVHAFWCFCNMLKYWLLNIFLILSLICGKFQFSKASKDNKKKIFVVKLDNYLLDELNEFQYLIPPAEIGELINKHFSKDLQFRKAMRFLRSRRFIQLALLTVTNPDVCQIVDYLQLFEKELPDDDICQKIAEHTSSMRDLSNFTRLIDKKKSANSSISNSQANNSTFTFTTFIEEVADKIPLEKFAKAIKIKCDSSDKNRTFYKSLRSRKLMKMIQHVSV